MSKNHSLTENTAIRACPDKRFCFFSAIKRSRKIRNERQKAHLFHTRKIFQPKNQRLRLKDFAGCIKFTLSSTTPPCAAFAIASPSLSGICRRIAQYVTLRGCEPTAHPSSAVSRPHKQTGNCHKQKSHRRITRQWQTNQKLLSQNNVEKT